MFRGVALVGLAALSWGTTGTMLKLMGAEAPVDALLVGALRMIVAAPWLLAAAVWRHGGIRRGGLGVAIAGLCIAAYQLCYFSAVPLSGVAATAVLAICSAPIMVALLASLVLRETFTRRRLLALALGVSGAALLVLGSPSRAGAEFGRGAILALGAGLAYSAYVVATKRSLAGTPPLAASAITFGVAALALLPLVAFRWAAVQELLARGAPELLYLGVVATAAAYALYAAGLRLVPAGAAVIAGLLEPLGAATLGAVLFGERVGPGGVAGGLLLLTAVLLLGGSETGRYSQR